MYIYTLKFYIYIYYIYIYTQMLESDPVMCFVKMNNKKNTVIYLLHFSIFH